MSRFYGVTAGGNFEDGGNILHRNKSMEEMASAEGLSVQDLEKALQRSRKKLLTFRERRVRPARDDKILTDWNGLMIAALAKGARALERPDCAQAAVKAADFVLATMLNPDGRLLHRYHQGEAGVPGYVDDYAFLAWGLIELYEVTFQARYLRDALAITDQMLELFWDDQQGGLYFTGADSEELITRTRESYDGAVPSGNSVAALNLLRLSRMTMRSDLQDRAQQLLRGFAGRAGETPTAYAQFLVAVDFSLGPTREIVIAGDLQAEDTREMLAALRRTFLPRKVVIFHPDGPEGRAVEGIVPWIKGQSSLDGRATAYVCRDFACQMPTNDVAEMMSLIESDD
ncbi:thioredoxin domain-containing protein [Candidatus Zixiibacteriota bacterium]